MNLNALENPGRTAPPGTLPNDPEPLPHVSAEEMMCVLAGHQEQDAQYRNACQLALIVFDSPDFIACMPIDAKRQLLELIATHNCTLYEAIYNHLAEELRWITQQT